jgi:CBS domain-containing protein
MMQVQDLMIDPVPAVAEDASLGQAAALMGEGGLPVLAVLRGPEVLGTLSLRDLALGGCARGRAPDTTPVSAVMTRRLAFCRLDADLAAALALMAEQDVEALLVRTESGKVIGLLPRLGVLEELARPNLEAHGPVPEYVRQVQGNPT